jgi:hypothetical protein
LESPRGSQAHSEWRGRGASLRPNNSSTEHSNIFANASAVATDGERRSPSIALTAAREMPARSASSTCDQRRALRCSRTKLDDIIVSFIDTILSLAIVLCNFNATDQENHRKP